jgi:hypothetical protein
MNRDFREFYRRWLDKANQYNTDNLSECFDKFVTLFILYNFQYSYIAHKENIVNSKGLFEDKKMATVIVKNHFPVDEFCNNLQVVNAVNTIYSLLSDGIFYIRDDAVDRKLLGKVRSTNMEHRCEGILEMLYFIRCNLFHGQKDFTENQKRILIPCIEILQVLNEIIFTSLGRSS